MCLRLFTTRIAVRPSLALSITLLLAAPAPAALADTMYKCVASNGKVAYSDLPCTSTAKVEKQFEVPAPQSEEAIRVRLAADKARREQADEEFRSRHLRRQSELEWRVRRGNGEGSYSSARPAPAESGDSGAVRRAAIAR